jgi:hypothetical protein
MNDKRNMKRDKQRRATITITGWEICSFVRDRLGALFDAEKLGTTYSNSA